MIFTPLAITATSSERVAFLVIAYTATKVTKKAMTRQEIDFTHERVCDSLMTTFQRILE